MACFFIKKYTQVYVGYIQQKKKKKVYVWYNKPSLLILRMVFHLAKLYLFWRVLEVRFTIFQCLALFGKAYAQST